MLTYTSGNGHGFRRLTAVGMVYVGDDHCYFSRSVQCLALSWIAAECPLFKAITIVLQSHYDTTITSITITACKHTRKSISQPTQQFSQITNSSDINIDVL